MNYLKRNESIKHIDEERSLTGLASIDLPHKKYFPKGALAIDYPQIKMYDYLYSKRKNHLDYIALNYLGHRLSFRKLFKNIEITAKAFKSHKIKNGDYIVIILPTIPEAVYIFLALNRIGAIPIFLDSKSNSKDILQAITSSQAKIVIMEKTSVMPEILNNSLSSQMPQIILVSPTLSLPLWLKIFQNIKYYLKREKSYFIKYVDWPKFLQDGKNYDGIVDSSYKEGDVAAIIYSSGTTCLPKPIAYTNETFTAMVRQLELGQNVYHEQDTYLNIIPLSSGLGLNNSLYTILCFGLEDILVPYPVINDLPRLIKKYQPNHFLGTPMHANILLKYLKANGHKSFKLSFLKSFVIGGSYLSSTTQYALDEELKKRGCQIMVAPGYGQNEAGPALSYSPKNFLENMRPGCSGIPLVGTKIAIFNPQNHEELPYGQNLEGEICYQTPCMMKGYAFNYQEDNNFYYHQWCHSGDLGKMDKDGGIYITGRIMRQIMHNGNLFSPREVEEYVRQNVPFIEECVLIGKPDEIEENIPILFYVLKEKYRESALIIRNALIKICYFLNDYQIPREFIELESLPLTPKLKIDYRFLEEMVKETPKTLKKTL